MINIQSERRIFGFSEDTENFSPQSNGETRPGNKEGRRLARAVSDSYYQKKTRVSLKILEKYIETPLCHVDELLYLRDFTSIPSARELSRSLSLQELDCLPSHLFEKSIKGNGFQQDLSTHSFLPTIAHEQFIELLENKELWGENLSCTVAEALTRRGYSTEIRDLDLSLYGDTSCWKEIRNLEGITFVNCRFNWEPDFSANTTTYFLGQEGQINLGNVIFKNCHFYHVCWMEFSFVDCIFDQCEMEGGLFVGATLENVQFRECCLTGCSFEDASIIRCVFIRTRMPCTHFLDASVGETRILDSNLRNVVFFHSFSGFQIDDQTRETIAIDRPIATILVDPRSPGFTTAFSYVKLYQEGHMIPLRIAEASPKVSEKVLSGELKSSHNALGGYVEEYPHDSCRVPIPQQLIGKLLDDKWVESGKVLGKAERIACVVDSIYLPGGEDMPACFYDPEASFEVDLRRTLLEMALIRQSFNRGIPLMAVCRGFQVVNVFFGARLIPHIGDANWKNEVFKLCKPKRGSLYQEVFSHALDNSLTSASYHHQAVPVERWGGDDDSKEYKTPARRRYNPSPPTEALDSVVVSDGLIKISELKQSIAVPMILLQFHPELYGGGLGGVYERMSPENDRFWKILSDSAEARRVKKSILKGGGHDHLNAKGGICKGV